MRLFLRFSSLISSSVKVLNMPSEFRFRGEWTDFVVESNLEVILCTLMEYFAKNVHVRTVGLLYSSAAIDAFCLVYIHQII